MFLYWLRICFFFLNLVIFKKAIQSGYEERKISVCILFMLTYSWECFEGTHDNAQDLHLDMHLGITLGRFKGTCVSGIFARKALYLMHYCSKIFWMRKHLCLTNNLWQIMVIPISPLFPWSDFNLYSTRKFFEMWNHVP